MELNNLLRPLEFGPLESASPREPVIFPFPSRAAVRCGLGPWLSEMKLRYVLSEAYRGRGFSDARRRGPGLAGQTA